MLVYLQLQFLHIKIHYALNLTTANDILPKHIENEVLQSVMVLLVSTQETSIIRKYLQPLDGHENVYRFRQQTDRVTYHIGKYGVCRAAVRMIFPGAKVHDSASNVSVMADQCFPNLGAIISVGVVCGIKSKVQLCDVLVSSKVINYDKALYEHQGYLPKGEAVTVSSQLIKLFAQPVQWPDDKTKKHLTDRGMPMPKVKVGTILSGPYVVSDPAIKRLIKNFADKAVGIEMNGAHLLPENQKATANIIIVKAVCDFGDGKNIERYNYTATLLAVDLAHKSLSNPQAFQVLEGLNTHTCT